MKVGDWWAGRRDRRGLRDVDIDRLARICVGEPAAHLRWVRERCAQFEEQDRIIYEGVQDALKPDLIKLTERILSLDRMRRAADDAQAALEEYPPITEAELSRRTMVEANVDETVIRARRIRDYDARRRPVAARVAAQREQIADAQRDIAERMARIRAHYDRERETAAALYAFYTRRVEAYLRVLLHRNPDRAAAMELLPSPVVVRPGWFDEPCPWPTRSEVELIEEVSS
ncbi:hypothetical protein [Prescottella equi]|uniref:hypothetical protein n=1 Tax=Rhodococcus hoagii TaxID=43767 RepID=UPI000A105FBA|nr:hypothetical protein [Prescottella equi]ORM02887.1 hypothetical protein A5N72_17020 [Prescottella equi]